jgi:hypothetical protein
VPQTLLQELKDARIYNAETVAKICLAPVLQAEQSGVLRGTRWRAQDVAAIALWTFSFGESEANKQQNPFQVINVALVERSAMKLYKLRGLIYLLLFGLRGLPRVKPPVLYRGIRHRVDLTKYKPGNVITWHGFSSTTADVGIATRFMTDKITGKCEGTLFAIHGNAWGYDIQPFSFFSDEEEILLEPEIDLKVVGIENTDNMIIVDLDMMPCPLLLEKLIPPAHP